MQHYLEEQKVFVENEIRKKETMNRVSLMNKDLETINLINSKKRFNSFIRRNKKRFPAPTIVTTRKGLDFSIPTKFPEAPLPICWQSTE